MRRSAFERPQDVKDFEDASKSYDPSILQMMRTLRSRALSNLQRSKRKPHVRRISATEQVLCFAFNDDLSHKFRWFIEVDKGTHRTRCPQTPFRLRNMLQKQLETTI